MIAFPPAKINLGLQIIRKRADGYHEIASCFYPVPWCDALEIIPAKEDTFTFSGLPVPGRPENNLCHRALLLLRENFTVPPVHMHLHKVIPMGAGLGGGSSDGAHTLRVLNALFRLELHKTVLQDFAARLGSDCPFFIGDTPVLASGTGTTLVPSAISLKGDRVMIIHPNIHVSTAEAYAGVQPGTPTIELSTILDKPDSWKEKLKNDFQPAITARYPEISDIIHTLYHAGAYYAAMTGSGSAVYGLFKSAPDQVSFPPGYAVLRGTMD